MLPSVICALFVQPVQPISALGPLADINTSAGHVRLAPETHRESGRAGVSLIHLQLSSPTSPRTKEFPPQRYFATLSARSGQNERRHQVRRPRPARYWYFPGSGGPEPPAGAGGRLSGPRLPVPLPPFAFLTLLLEVLAGASAGSGCAVPCATLTFELEVVCGAFCACVTVASAKRLTHITDPRIRNDIVGPSWNCRSTTALNPRGAVFSSVISALCQTRK